MSKRALHLAGTIFTIAALVLAVSAGTALASVGSFSTAASTQATDPGTQPSFPGFPGIGLNPFFPWLPPIGSNPGYPVTPTPTPNPNPNPTPTPGNPGNNGPVQDGFPQGFVVPTSTETGQPVGGWGGDPTGQTDGGPVMHIPILFVHGNSRDAHDFDQVRQYFLDHGYNPSELWAVSYGYGSTQQLDTNDQSYPTIQAFVNNMLDYLQKYKDPNITQVDIISHSMGGTVVRKWLKTSGDYAKVHSFVEIAGPNHGLDGVPTSTQSGQELQPGGQWLNDLNAGGETPGGIRYETIYDGTGQYDQFYQGTLKDSPALSGATNHPYNVEHGTSFDHLGLVNGTEDVQYQWVSGDTVSQSQT